MHAVSTSQIRDILHFYDKSLYHISLYHNRFLPPPLLLSYISIILIYHMHVQLRLIIILIYHMHVQLIILIYHMHVQLIILIYHMHVQLKILLKSIFLFTTFSPPI